MGFHHHYNPVSWAPSPVDGAAFSPASLSPTLWLDPSDLSTVFVERTAPTTPASVDGVVGTIRDKSGNNRHFAATSDAARPILRQSGALYYLEFDGTDDIMHCSAAASTIITTTAYDLVVAANFPTIGTDSLAHDLNDCVMRENASISWSVAFVRSSGTINGVNYDGTADLVSTAYSAGTPFVWAQRHDSGTLYAQLNSGLELSVASGTTNGTLAGAVTLAGRAANSVFANMHFYGAIAKNSVLTETERTKARSYLAEKIGVSL